MIEPSPTFCLPWRTKCGAKILGPQYRAAIGCLSIPNRKEIRNHVTHHRHPDQSCRRDDSVGPLVVRFLLTGEQSNGNVAIFELTVPAGQKLPAPAHSHDHYEETIYGLDER